LISSYNEKVNSIDLIELDYGDIFLEKDYGYSLNIRIFGVVICRYGKFEQNKLINFVSWQTHHGDLRIIEENKILNELVAALLKIYKGIPEIDWRCLKFEQKGIKDEADQRYIKTLIKLYPKRSEKNG
jgi:hypothetical protein